MNRQEFTEEIERAIEMVDQARHIVEIAQTVQVRKRILTHMEVMDSLNYQEMVTDMMRVYKT